MAEYNLTYIAQGQGVATLGALARAFNLRNVQTPDVRNNEYNSWIVQGDPYQRDPELYKSLLGTPVYADVTLLGGSYTDNITGRVVEYPQLRFDSVILTIDFAQRIVKTEIQGRDGTVKEYIGEDDAKITIQGIICGKNGVYPIDEVSLLNQWRKAPVTKGIVSRFMQNLGIDNLVVEDCSIPQVAGGYSYQTFTINAISDLPVELIIK